jgi:hypothetical protein
VIGEAIDTAVTLGWALAAWIAVLAMVAAIVLLAGTAVGVWAVRGARRVLYGRLSASGPSKAPGEGRGAHNASERRVRLFESGASAVTAPCTRRARGWSASRGADAGFPIPAIPGPSESRTRPRVPSWAHTGHHRTEEAA